MSEKDLAYRLDEAKRRIKQLQEWINNGNIPEDQKQGYINEINGLKARFGL